MNDQELFSIAEVARLLSMSETTVRQQVRLGLLAEGHKIPGQRSVRWFRIDVQNYLDKIRRGDIPSESRGGRRSPRGESD